MDSDSSASSDDEVVGVIAGDNVDEEDDDWEDVITDEINVSQIGDGGGDTIRSRVERNNNKESVQLSWKEDKLFPPDKRSNVSTVWKHGGFKKDDNGKLIKDKVICSYCGTQLKYNSSPQSFMNHLKSLHFEKVKDDHDDNENSSAGQSKIESFMIKRAEVKYKPNDPRQKRFRSNQTRWIIKHKRPFKIVEDEGYRKMVSDLDPRITVPSGMTISRDILGLFKKHKKLTIEKFKNIDYFTCTTDAGSSLAGHTFVDINVHFLDENFKPEKKIVAVVPVVSKTAPDYRAVTEALLDEHGIKEKVFSYTTDNEATMVSCFPKSVRNGCLAHIESKASEKACDAPKRLKMVRKKFRKVVRKSNKSSKLKAFIKEEQLKRDLKPITLKPEVKTRFTATTIMLKSVLNDPNDKTEEEADREKVFANVEAINTALQRVVKDKEELETLKITDSDAKVCLNIIPLLDILEESISLLGGELYSTGSCVLPFLVKTLKHVEPDEDDVTYVKTFKEVLKDQLISRTKEHLNFFMLAKASFFDPRFRHLSFLESLSEADVTGLTREEVHERVKLELEILNMGSNLEIPDELLIDSQPAKKKRKFFDDDDESITKPKDYNDEFENYSKERTLRMSDSPFTWWNGNKMLYPSLAKLARKYLTVQATSTPAERVMSEMGNILTKKRLAMSDEKFSMAIYLSDCV